MPLLPQWGQVDPWGKEVESQRQAYAQNRQTLQGALNQFQQGLQRSVDRRQALDAQNQHFRDQEYALINTATDQLVQPKTNSKVTDLQLQQVGQQMKSEYYDAVKTYQNSDKGDEARQTFEAAKAKALGSARTVSGALDKLTAATTTFEEAWNTGGVSDAMNPSVRQFMIDLVNPETPSDQFQIVTDPETQQLKYQGKTTTGDPVDFFLSDIANGDNAFAPIPKADMPQIVSDLTKGLKGDMIEEKRENGDIVKKTNWASLGNALDLRMEELLQDEKQFRAIAAGEGFGWDAFNAVKSGEVWTDKDGTEYTSFEDIKKELKQDLLYKIEKVTPHEEVVIKADKTPTLSEQAQIEEKVETQRAVNNEIITAAGKKDLNYFRDNMLGRVKGVDDMKLDGNKLVMYGYTAAGKGKPVHVFDLSNTGDVQRLAELGGGNRDLAAMESNIINF